MSSKALATGLELSRDRFLLPELTALDVRSAEARAPRRSIAADLTGAYLEASIAALKDLFDATGLAAYVPARQAVDGRLPADAPGRACSRTWRLSTICA